MNFEELLAKHRDIQRIECLLERMRRKATKKSKSLSSFIRENREEIDNCILRVVPNIRLNDRERRLWILNDEGLYRWARLEGVKI